MARSLLAIVAGYSATAIALALMGWAMSTLAPTGGLSGESLFLWAPDVLWIMTVTGVSGLAAGYLTASVARRAPVLHTLALAAPILAVLIVGAGPSLVITGVICLVRLPFSSPADRHALLDTLATLTPVGIGALFWSPAVVLGGWLWAVIRLRVRPQTRT